MIFCEDRDGCVEYNVFVAERGWLELALPALVGDIKCVGIEYEAVFPLVGLPPFCWFQESMVSRSPLPACLRACRYVVSSLRRGISWFNAG